MAKKLVSSRDWLEPVKHSNSSYCLWVGTADYDSGEVRLELADCQRKIEWYFGKPGSARGKAKIKKLKKLVDEMYNFLHKIEE